MKPLHSAAQPQRRGRRMSHSRVFLLAQTSVVILLTALGVLLFATWIQVAPSGHPVWEIILLLIQLPCRHIPVEVARAWPL